MLASAGLSLAGLDDEVTDGATKVVRLDELVYQAAELVPGLVPTRAEVDAERERKLADKQGVELAQGLLIAELLAQPRVGRQLVEAMLAPMPEALVRFEQFRATGVADLGPVHVTRHGRAASSS